MSMDSVSEENVSKLTNDHKSKLEVLEDIIKTSIETMWLRELEILESEYDKFIDHRKNERENEVGNKKKKSKKI